MKGRPRRKVGRRAEMRKERRGEINTNRLTGGPAEGKTETVIVVRGEEMSMT